MICVPAAGSAGVNAAGRPDVCFFVFSVLPQRKLQSICQNVDVLKILLKLQRPYVRANPRRTRQLSGVEEEEERDESEEDEAGDTSDDESFDESQFE